MMSRLYATSKLNSVAQSLSNRTVQRKNRPSQVTGFAEFASIVGNHTIQRMFAQRDMDEENQQCIDPSAQNDDATDRSTNYDDEYQQCTTPDDIHGGAPVSTVPASSAEIQNVPTASAVHSLGWRPDANKPGPYAHATVSNGENLQLGIGMLHVEGNNEAKMDVNSANAEFGFWGNAGKDQRVGIRGDAQLFNGSTGNSGPVGADMGIFNANAEISSGANGATAGASASVIQGAVRFGALESAHSTDEQARFGLGYGVGAAGRLHWGDKDQDGHWEYGLGADIGPVSFDITSEDPLRTLTNASLPGRAMQWGADKILGADANMTDMAVDGAKKVPSSSAMQRARPGIG